MRAGPRLAVLLAALLCAHRIAAQAESRPESLPVRAAVEEALEKIRAKHGVPALAAAATDADRLLVIGAAGVRKKGSDVKATVHDRWHLGSCTKSMTATLLARLVDRGVLRWDTTIGEVFRERDDLSEAYRPVTVELLLANRGGVPADLSAGGLWGRLWKRNGTPTDQRAELFDGVITRAPATRPGTTFLYSNAGFAVAGHMAERLTGKSWEDLMRLEMFEPLGMKDSGFGAPGLRGSVDEPWGHAADGSVAIEPGPNADNPPAIGPAGIVHATLADWAKYAAMHLRGANGGAKDYLKPETFARIQAPPAEGNYAFGWGHHDRPWADGHVLTHNGSNTMWFCVIWVAPKRGQAFLAVCNAGGNAAAAATDEAVGALIRATAEAPVRR